MKSLPVAVLCVLAILVVVCSGELPGYWKNWGPCSEPCGKGEQVRFRKCFFRGRLLDCGKKVATCNAVPCEDPSLSLDWENCSADCEGGQKRGFYGNTEMASTECNHFPCSESQTCSGRNLLIAVDSSGSIGVDNWPSCKQFAIDLAMSAHKMAVDKISIIRYSVESLTVKTFHSPFSQKALEDAVWSIRYDASSTYLDSAMDNVVTNLNQLSQVERQATTVVIMSDGPSIVSGGVDQYSVDLAGEIKAKGTTIVGVKIGGAINNELPLLASTNALGVPNVISAEDHQHLYQVVDQVIAASCV